MIMLQHWGSWVSQGRNREETPEKSPEFIKLMIEPKGENTEEGRPSKMTQGLALPGCFYKLGTKGARTRRRAF